MRKVLLILLLCLVLVGCGGRSATTPPAATATASNTPVPSSTSTMTPTPTETPVPPPPVYIGAVLGLDADPAYPERNLYGVRSDVIDLIRVVEPTTGPVQITIISFPRDLWIPVPCSPLDPSLNGYDRVNAAWAYGQFDCFKATMALQGLEINAPIVALRFDEFLHIVDLMGGLDVVPTETYRDWCGSYHGTDGSVGGYRTWVKGQSYHMLSNELLCYARGRHGAADGDLDRNRRAIEIIKAMLAQWPAQVFDGGDTISSIRAWWNLITSSTQTDAGLADVLKFAPIMGRVWQGDYEVHSVEFTLNETAFWRTPIYNASVLLPTVNTRQWLACEVLTEGTEPCTGMFKETPVQLVTPEATP